MKFAYTVTGSEDGVISVHSSYAKAEAAARDYLANNGDVTVYQHGKHYTSIVADDGTSADIERFIFA